MILHKHSVPIQLPTPLRSDNLHLHLRVGLSKLLTFLKTSGRAQKEIHVPQGFGSGLISDRIRIPTSQDKPDPNPYP